MADPFGRRFLPQIGYWNENTGIMQNGALFAMLHVAGHASDLASARAMIAARDQLNMTMMNIADPNLEVWFHFVRAAEQKPTVLPPADTWFGRRFDVAYRACLEGGLFRNDLFVTFVLRPAFDARKMLARLFGRGPRAPRELPSAERTMVQDFEALVGSAEAELRRYGVRRLGIRREGERTFMEMAEALHYILHGYARKIGTIAGTGRMGRLICPSRPVFGHKAYRLDSDLGSHLGAVLSLMDYPEPVTPTMFEALVRAPFACTLTNSFQFRSRAKAMSKLVFKERQMRSSNDPAKSQLAAVERAKDELQSRAYVNGEHHFALAVRAPTLEALDRAAAVAATMLSNAGITAVRENEALRPGFYAQLPGCAQWRPRPGGINSRNLASLAALNNVPVGQPQSRWGAPIIMFRTTADTEYAFHLQAQGSPSIPAEDLANVLTIGRSGSGKTTLTGAVTVLSGRQGVQRVVIDKDLGLAPCIEACSGDYLVIPANEDTGVAPLLAAQDTPKWRAHIEDLVIDLVQAGGSPGEPYQFTADEDARLRRAVEMQVQMPPELRELGGIQAMLGQRNKDGAAARLKKWCRGERLGWVFDGAHDVLRGGNAVTGFDTTALLKNTMVAGPLLRHLFYRTDQRITGSPLLIAIDEFWQASDKPVFVDMTNDKAKTGRKREVALILATQSAHDALASPMAHTLKQQFPTKIFFGDEEASADELIDGLGLTVPEYKAVTQMLPRMQHAFLIKRPGASVICRNDLSKALAQVSVLSGRDATYELMRELQATHGPAPEQWVPFFEEQAPQLSKKPRVRRKEQEFV
jgi:type IV secretion system protein VirB4